MGTNQMRHFTEPLKFDGSKVFFTSDTHFFHDNIIRYCRRPFKDSIHMNEILIQNWNETVSPDDIVFHLGDFSYGSADEWKRVLNRLNGKIYLIVGNHDMKNLSENHYSRFEDVARQMYILVDGQKIYLNHFPMLAYGWAYRDVWQLFGHVHSGPLNITPTQGVDIPRLKMLMPTQYDVGVDNNDFRPVSFAKVKAIIERQIEAEKKYGWPDDWQWKDKIK